MATQTIVIKTRPARWVAITEAIVNKRDELADSLIPRPCMLRSVGLILAGLCVPVLMLLEVIPVTLFLAFIGLALTAAGGISALILFGEI